MINERIKETPTLSEVLPELNISPFELWNIEAACNAFWFGQVYKNALHILVPDSGSDAAIAYAIENPNAEVLAISTNTEHLAQMKEWKKKKSLKHLTIKECAIEQAHTLQQTFDFIDASTTVQHSSSPVNALTTLSSLLTSDGVIALTCNAKYGQLGVRMLQEVYQILDVKNTPEEITFIQSTLATLRKDHFANLSLPYAGDLKNPSSVAQLFLQGDVPLYTVGECLQLLDHSQLRFQGWKDNFYYYPEGIMKPDEPLYQHLKSVPDKELWQMVELLQGNIPFHQVFACRSERKQETYALQFEHNDFLNYIPLVANLELKTSERFQKTTWLQHHSTAIIPLNEAEEKIYRAIDGVATVVQCAGNISQTIPQEERIALARAFFIKLWRCGILLFKK